MAPEKERRKIQNLLLAFDKKAIDRPIKIELYQDGQILSAEIAKKYDQGVIKYFLKMPTETIKAGYPQSLWEKELSKWVWGSRELNLEP